MTDTVPAASLPQIAVQCPACGAVAGALCTSHGGTRTRTHNTHQVRTRAYNDTRKDISR